jgi:hypothetical protein
MNKKQTFKDQCIEKRRPRICFSEIYKQLKNKYIQLIWSGYLNNF